MRRFAPTLKGLSLLMEPHHFFTAQRVLIVAGKGGVGKSTVATSLAHLSARSGLRTLLVSLTEPAVGIPTHELLEQITVSPGRALSDYLATKGLGLLSRQLAKSGIMELVATTAPGLDDLLVLGRIKAFEQELRADVIIVDGPAAGHAIDLVQAPIQLKRAISTGPIGSQADEVLNMLSDGNRCKLLMVTTAAITPIAETMEAIAGIQSTVNMSLAPIVINRCDEDVPEINATLTSPLAEAYAYARERYVAQQDAMTTLRDDVATTQIHVARHRLSGAALVEEIAADIAAQIGGAA